MIKIILGNKLKEASLVDKIHGEFMGRMYVTFPIKHVTRKVRGKKLYEVINSRA